MVVNYTCQQCLKPHTWPDIVYTPNLNYYGPECISFRVNDGESDSNISSACANVLPVNDPPVADGQSVTTEKDTIVHITLTGSDIENDPLTFGVVAPPSHGTLFGAAPELRYIPDKNYVGNDLFTFKANDGVDDSIVATISISITGTVEEPQQTDASNNDTIPRFTGLEIIDGESKGRIYQLADRNEKLPNTQIQAGQEVKIRVRIDDKEASSNILHFGMYLDIRDRTSDPLKSNAYLIYEKGKSPTIVDSQGLFESATIAPVFEGRSLWMESKLVFQKPMIPSDIIFETWNESRHPIYYTVPKSLEIISHEESIPGIISTPQQSDEMETNQDEGRNISGTVILPEKPSTDPIKVFSLAAGKVREIKNNNSVIIENQDLSIKVEGFLKDAIRGDVVDILILRPDDSVYKTSTVLDKTNHYSIPLKLHTKWSGGIYNILASSNEKQFGKISFIITDSSEGEFGGIIEPGNESLLYINDYLEKRISESELIESLSLQGWSVDRIDEFLQNNRIVQYPPNTFLYVIIGMLSLLIILSVALSNNKRHIA